MGAAAHRTRASALEGSPGFAGRFAARSRRIERDAGRLRRRDTALAHRTGGIGEDRSEVPRRHSRHLLTVPAPALPATTSLLTLVDGQIVHEDAELAGATQRK